jgi:hypothetical protein
MSIRLVVASLWLPPWTVRRELARVGEATTAVLDGLLRARAPDALHAIRQSETPLRGTATRRRAALAAAHTERVARLIDSVGREKALSEARAALFVAGIRLGEDARNRLGVRKTRRDLLQAARVLYRVLGIRFRAEWGPHDEARIRIPRCALARGYSREACLALSATDSGVVAGLWQGARLEFDERITEGKPACIARLTLPRQRGEGT